MLEPIMSIKHILKRGDHKVERLRHVALFAACGDDERLLGALAVGAVGVVHLQAYDGPYSAVPAIGVLFFVNFAAATAIGMKPLLPVERLAGRWGGIADELVAVAGIALAAGSLTMLIVAEQGPLFGFHEPGYDPQAISTSRSAEVVTVGLLTASLALRGLTKASPRW